jgi:hypothetical protein
VAGDCMAMLSSMSNLVERRLGEPCRAGSN